MMEECILFVCGILAVILSKLVSLKINDFIAVMNEVKLGSSNNE